MIRRRRKTGPSKAQAEVVLARSGSVCEVCGNAWAEQLHHRRPRASGGSRRVDTNSPANILALCAQCHTQVESKRSWAIVHGRLLQQHQDPAVTPVLLRHGWLLLHDNGTTIGVEGDR